MPSSPFNAPEPNLAALGVKVARVRQARGWSLNELHRRSGISRKSLVNIEAARHVPRLETLHALAHILEVPIGDLAASLCDGHEGSSGGGGGR